MSEPILSYELKTVLDYIKTDMVKEFPINTITLNYLILAILDNQNCDGYAVISKLMMHSSISEFKGYMSNIVLADCQADINNGNDAKFSHEFDDLATNIANEGKTVTTALMLREIAVNNFDILTKLEYLGVTTDQMTDAVMAYNSLSIVKDTIKPGKHTKKKPPKHRQDKIETEFHNARVIPEENNSVEANCENLVRNASIGMYDSLIGMDDIITDIFDVLGKYDRNTVAIIGPSGVGKTSIVERMAKKIYDLECPKTFKGKYIMKFSDQINSIIINDMNRIGKYIAFIDDVERMFVSKDTEMNNLYVLNELFRAPNVPTILCMNDSQYTKIIGSKPEMSRKIHKVKIDEPCGSDLVNIVTVASKSISDYNNVVFDESTIHESIRLAKRFISDEKAPKSALNILDMAASHVKTNQTESTELIQLRRKLKEITNSMNSIPNSGNSDDFDKKDQLIREEIEINKEIAKLENSEFSKMMSATIDDIRYATSRITDIPLTEMNEDERGKLKNLFTNLTQQVIGQDSAVEDICRAVKRQRVGLSNPNKPCVMLFCGNTGTGKSFLAKRLAYEMFGDENNMVRLDMSEYSEKTSVTKLYGASAGYIGYEEGGVLTEAIKKKPRCVLLLDEIEKAHDDVYNVFLQVFDEGRLSDNKGTLVDFKNVIIIMTSNVGAKNVSEKTPRIGFTKPDENSDNKDIIIKAIKKEFKPEFINRIDNICYFNQLTDDNLRTIIKNEIKKVRNKLIELGYDMDDDLLNGILVDNIFNKIKEEAEYGARPIIREIQKQLEDKLTDYIIDNNIQPGFIFKYSDIY